MRARFSAGPLLLMTIRTRFAPSPTGDLHIGGVRTALFAWLYARRAAGKFILRIEDTDRERSSDDHVTSILEAMAWLGLDVDEGPIFQTQRFDRYGEVIEQFLQAGLAYRCYCSKEELDAMRAEAMAEGHKPRYNGRCRDLTAARTGPSVVRFKNPPDGTVILDDQVKGKLTFDNAELDDLIIARTDGTPTYNFTVVVDDADMAITHVIRGDDHVNNTPRQINLFEALGFPPPVFAHLPNVNGSDGAKLSKRHGAVSVLEYRRSGYLPEALLNYLVRLGWSHGDQEVFTVAQMIEYFDLAHVQRAPASFDADKLLWLNQEHIKSSAPERLVPLLAEHLAMLDVSLSEGPSLEAAVEALQPRSRTLVEMAEQAVCYFRDFDDFDPKSAKNHLRPVSAQHLREVRARLAGLGEWTEATTEAAVEQTAEALDLKLGKVAQPLRVALTGQAASPGIGTTLALVGRDRSLARIDAALVFIEARVAAD
jgi:glutamyl-tRNA synthetase